MSIPSTRRGYPREAEYSVYINNFCYIARRTLSATEFKALNTSPVTIAPATPAYYYLPIYTSWHKKAVVQFGVGAVTGLQCRVGTSAVTSTGAPAGFALAPLYHIVMWGPGNSAGLFSGSDLAATPLNSATINLFAAGGNPTAIVDGTVEVEVGYRRIPVF